MLGESDGKIRDQIGWTTISQILRHPLTTTESRLNVVETLLSNEYIFIQPFQNFSDAAVKRSFSVLTVADAIAGDQAHCAKFSTGILTSIACGIRDYFVRENDYRGFDERLGWIHCHAHAGDCFFALNSHSNFSEDDVVANIKTIFDAVQARGHNVFCWGEEYRLARPIANAMARVPMAPVFDRFTQEFMLNDPSGQNFMNMFRAVYLEILWANGACDGQLKILEKIIRV